MIKVIDYGFGNSGSVINMIFKLGGCAEIAEKPSGLHNARLVILPGVGSFDSSMIRLRERGFDKEIMDIAADGNIYFLGICLGMQLLFEGSEEGVESGLGIIPGHVRKFRFDSSDFKIPHMGWNQVVQVNDTGFLDGSIDGSRFYFTHSYHIHCADDWILGRTEYGYEFPSIVAKGMVYGAQFHPEKSHRFGLEFLNRFIVASDGK